MDNLKKIIRTFAYVIAGITISATIFITIFIPKAELQIYLLWQIIIMSAVCSLGNFIYYGKAIFNKRQMIARIICHYIYINIVVFGGALLWGWLTPVLLPEFLVMLLLVAVVYGIITIVNFRQEEKIAEVMNRQLRDRYPSQEEGENS